MKTRILFAVAVFALGMFGCAKDAPPSVFDPNAGTAAQPVITSMSPQGGALAGVTSITITGQNFSATPEYNIVYFDAVAATVLQASTTQLVVKAPSTVKDSIKVKISVQDAALFSSSVFYNLAAAAPEFGNLSPSEKPFGVECDTAGNLYISVVSSGTGLGVQKITPAGDRTQYSPVFSSGVANWRGMKFGPGGGLYCVTSRPIIFRIPSGGGTAAIWLSTGLTSLYDIDFDQAGNMWGVGPGSNIYRIKSDKTVKSYPFVGTMRSVRVFNGYLYVGGLRDSLEQVWRLPIDASGDLGPEEVYFNLSSLYGPNSFGVQAITFSSDGEMYIGTDGADAIVNVHPNKTGEGLYPGVFAPTASAFAWGKGASLFVSKSTDAATGTILKVNTQKSSAPYYGRTLP